MASFTFSTQNVKSRSMSRQYLKDLKMHVFLRFKKKYFEHIENECIALIF